MDAIFIPNLEMRKLKPTEVACLAQGHGAAKYLRGFDAGSLTQVPTHAI